MNNKLILSFFLFIVIVKAEHVDVEKVKQIHKNYLQSLTGKIVDASLMYGIVGYSLKGVGAGLHTLSGNPYTYEYITQHFGQIHNLEYFNEYKSFSPLQEICSRNAQRFLTAGSIVHWPIRSAWDFLNGVIVQTKYISNIQKNLQNKEVDFYEKPTKLLQDMKNIRRQAAFKTSIGMAIGFGPIAGYHVYEKYLGTEHN